MGAIQFGVPVKIKIETKESKRKGQKTTEITNMRCEV